MPKTNENLPMFPSEESEDLLFAEYESDGRKIYFR
jgi:hypothetical protein